MWLYHTTLIGKTEGVLRGNIRRGEVVMRLDGCCWMQEYLLWNVIDVW